MSLHVIEDIEEESRRIIDTVEPVLIGVLECWFYKHGQTQLKSMTVVERSWLPWYRQTRRTPTVTVNLTTVADRQVDDNGGLLYETISSDRSHVLSRKAFQLSQFEAQCESRILEGSLSVERRRKPQRYI